jgi:hypothetical protein
MTRVKENLLLLVLLLLWMRPATYGQKANVEALIAQYRTKDSFNGTVLIARKDKIDYLTYIGLSNREDSIKYL